MTRLSRPYAGPTSHALLDMTRGRELPYRAEGPRGSVLVTEVAPKDGVTIGWPVKRDSYHLIGTLAAAWDDGRMILGARWLCGAGSIGVKVSTPEALDEFYAPFFGDDGRSIDDMVCGKCRRQRDGETGPCVYRVYDKTGDRLLYIGSTKNWDNRRAQHRSSTWWWQLAKNVDLTFYGSIREAREAEAQAIRAERPQMNVMHNRQVGQA